MIIPAALRKSRYILDTGASFDDGPPFVRARCDGTSAPERVHSVSETRK
jgi:hypothetical protein